MTTLRNDPTQIPKRNVATALNGLPHGGSSIMVFIQARRSEEINAKVEKCEQNPRFCVVIYYEDIYFTRCASFSVCCSEG